MRYLMVLANCIFDAICGILIVGILGLLIVGEFFLIKDTWKNKKER